MDYFEIKIREKDYLIKPFIDDDNLRFTTEVDGKEILFGGTGNGLAALDPQGVDETLLEEIALEIDSYFM